MNQEPDNYEYTNRIYGLPWYIAFGVPFVILLVCVWLMVGCTYNRNAPLISAPLINANGNTATVPLVGQ
jgi:hypothetical protein